MHHLQMNILTLILAIGMVKFAFASRCQRSAASAPMRQNRGAVMQDEVSALKTRIASQERIAVDDRNSEALAAQIDALRN